MDDKYASYFSSINSMANKILKDEAILKKAVKNQWNDLTWKEKESLIDDFMVDQTTRERYCQVDKLASYKQSFPKLKVETGEKIVVDFENDFWTWQDEHSAPFNWRSKSQQDLTLDDLEPDVLTKPLAKNKKKDGEDSKTDEPMAGREFSVESSGEIWNSPALQGVQKPELLDRSRSVSPTKSMTASRESLNTSRSKTPDAINYGFTGSVDDLSSPRSSRDFDRSPSVSSGGETLGTSPDHDASSKPNRPTRRQRSFSKSPIKSVLAKRSDSDFGSESLVSSHKDDDINAFDNPAMGNQWSDFVNQTQDVDTSSSSPSPHKMLLTEPEPVSMDRGRSYGDQSDSGLLTGSPDFDHDFKDEVLVIETHSASGIDDLNESSASKSGFDFLDNW